MGAPTVPAGLFLPGAALALTPAFIALNLAVPLGPAFALAFAFGPISPAPWHVARTLVLGYGVSHPSTSFSS